ncbi:TIGR01777 family oxidoreductase [Nocardioides caldifontis]|uniref:TIGR01777 family oxidoreductase n=1 Tax=Nocardioides caldifontis TaxID=2588938 RepID=UPI0011E060DC|nr:TIGR01777 family oxidoreductase [Nocardioides caldifontis]
MRFVVAGASGFLGGAWTQALVEHGHEVVRLVRREPTAADEVRWDPASGTVDRAVVERADVVANLAGAPLVHVPWNERYRRTFTASRVDTTRTLAQAIAGSDRMPAFLAQSGVAAYGDRGSTVITEDSPVDARTFMGDVVRRWEAATEPAREAGARVALMRTSVVLDRRGGALPAMLLPFRLGLGGRIGNGEQFFATISLHDWLTAATFLAHNELSGPFNLTGPEPSTNAEFTEALGKALGRPTVLRVPSLPLRATALVGPIGGEILASQRLEPKRLLEAGYAFAHNDITDRLAAALR